MLLRHFGPSICDCFNNTVISTLTFLLGRKCWRTHRLRKIVTGSCCRRMNTVVVKSGINDWLRRGRVSTSVRRNGSRILCSKRRRQDYFERMFNDFYTLVVIVT